MNEEIQPTKGKPTAVWILILLLVFLGLSGIYGGYNLFLDDTGQQLGFPPDMIDQVPLVNNYYLIGIFLFVVYGAGSLALAFLTWRARIFSPSAIGIIRSLGVLLGALLTIWVAAQLILLKGAHFIQFIYIATGLAISVLFASGATRRYLFGVE